MKGEIYIPVSTQSDLPMELLSTSTSHSTAVRLCEAIMLSDIDEVDRILKVKVNLEDCYEKGVLPHQMTVLHIAAKKQKGAYLKRLLENKLFRDVDRDVDIKDGLGYTPLMHAADAGSIENVKLLIQSGDISMESNSRLQGGSNNQESQQRFLKSADRKPDSSLQKCLKRTVLHIAAGRGHKDIIEEVLNKINRSDINKTDDNGWTPLFWAAQSGDVKCFNLLLDRVSYGLLSAKDNSLRNVFHIIAENNCHQILEEICNKYGESIKELLNQCDKNQLTPFMTSIRKGNVETAELLKKYVEKDAGRIENVQLLIQSAEITVKSNSRLKGGSNNQESQQRGHKDIIEELLNKINRIDINQIDENGWTPLIWAAKSGDLKCFNLVLSYGLFSEKDNSLRNVFHIIAENNCHEILEEICNKYGDSIKELLNQCDKNQLTPFMTSIRKGNVETAKLLMKYVEKDEKGKTVLHQDVNGNTVFHLAAERGRYDALLLLLSPHIMKLKTLLNDDKVFLANATQTGTTSADSTLLLQIVNSAEVSEPVDHQFNNIWYPDELIKRNENDSNCFHLAAGSGNIRCLHIIYACCITMQQGFISFPLKYLDKKNKSQLTPLHYAIRSRSPNVIKFLVTHGADLMSRSKLLPMLPNTSDLFAEERVADVVDCPKDETSSSYCPITFMRGEEPTSLQYILKMPNGANIIKELLDESVAHRNNEDDGYELVVDFRLLICNSGLRMAITHEIFRHRYAGLLDVLLHPLMKSFIEREWMKRKYFPWFHFAVYLIYLICLTVYVWLPQHAYLRIYAHICACLVSILSLVILLLCVPYFLPGQKFCERVKGILQRVPPPVFALIVIFAENSGETPSPFRSLTVTLSWLSLIFHSGTLTSLNQQAAQFQAVLFTMLSNAPVFFIVIFGFAFSFYVLYFEEDNFENIWNAFLYTSVVMLQGGMDESPYFSRNTTEVAHETLIAEGSVSFLFMVVVTLALLNMLVGLAISSAEELRNEGRIVFIRQQVTLLFELEQILEMLEHLHLKKLWRKIRGVRSYYVTHPDTIAKDHRMVVNNHNTSLERQIELRDICKSSKRN